MKSIAIGLLILLTSCAGYEPTPLTTNQIVGEVAWQAIHIVDWGQTLDIADNPDRYHEINPIIGRHPSRGRVNMYMGASALLHPLVTYMLPEEAEILGFEFNPRWVWLGGTIATSGACVINNQSIGLKMAF